MRDMDTSELFGRYARQRSELKFQANTGQDTSDITAQIHDRLDRILNELERRGIPTSKVKHWWNLRG